MTALAVTENDITALRGALELARDKYVENAAAMRSTGAGLVPAYDRLAQQFDRQANDAAKLIERLDDLC